MALTQQNVAMNLGFSASQVLSPTGQETDSAQGAVSPSGGGSASWDVTTAVYHGDNFTFASQLTSETGLQMSPDGSKMYVGKTTGIWQYTLSTPYDASTGTYASKTFPNDNLQNNNWQDFSVSQDGAILYVLGDNNIVYQFALSTARDISTASYAGKSFSLTSQIGSGVARLYVSNDGATMFAIRTDSLQTVYKYNVGTPGDVSTATYSGTSMDTHGHDVSPQGLAFEPDLSRMYIAGGQFTYVHMYVFTGGTFGASYTFNQYNIGSIESHAQGLCFSNDGFNMYTAGRSNNSVFQWSLS